MVAMAGSPAGRFCGGCHELVRAPICAESWPAAILLDLVLTSASAARIWKGKRLSRSGGIDVAGGTWQGRCGASPLSTWGSHRETPPSPWPSISFGGEVTVSGGGVPLYRSTSTRQLLADGPWVKEEVPISLVTALGLP